MRKIRNKKRKYLIGIDEAGRGPLAGPVAVGLVAIPESADWRIRELLSGVRDSKQLSEKEREDWFIKIKTAEKSAALFSAVSLVSEKIIDSRGISFAIHLGIKKCLNKFEGNQISVRKNDCEILLDGSLKAPKEYKDQKTIIKGDAKVPIIGLASIVAKVSRDKKMRSLAKKYPKYGFEIHKGYGTKKHYEAIKKHGISSVHRKSFLKNINKVV